MNIFHDRAHQGVDSIAARAGLSVYWSGIDTDIQTFCKSCENCQKIASSQQKEPMIFTQLPAYPFQQVAADLFSANNTIYLAFACRLTGWLEIAHFPFNTTLTNIIKVLLELFQRFGIPEEISLDGGPNLDSKETLLFLSTWGVTCRLSSAYYPQSNGRAEAAVKTCKCIICGNTGSRGTLNTDSITRALLQYRHTQSKVLTPLLLSWRWAVTSEILF